MTESELQDRLLDLIGELLDAREDGEDANDDVADLADHSEAGLLTSNAGLVLSGPEGEFQITIVRRR
jgi:hypothetical protein